MTTSRRPTIDDVAQLAGVSRQTVSNVLRRRGRLSEPTRRRVLAAVEQLGYVAHSGASSLRSRRTMQLAYPMPAPSYDPANAIAMEFVQALIHAAGERQHHLLLTAGDSDEELIELIRSGRVDGFVFSNLEPDDHRVELVAGFGLPFAGFGRTDPGQPQNWVDIDNAAGTAVTTNLLVDKGHTDIAFLGFRTGSTWDDERLAGYRTSMAARGLRPRVELCPTDPIHIAASTHRLLAGDRAPSAIVTGSDVLAAGVYAAAERNGIVIGRDLAVTGFDHSVVGRSLSPRLTTLAIPLSEIAGLVVDRVLSELETTSDRPGQLVELELVMGEST